MADPKSADAVLTARLDELARESAQRTIELNAIAAQLPAVVGRRAMIRTLLGDAAHNPNKGEILRRGIAKAVRHVRELGNRIRFRVRSDG